RRHIGRILKDKKSRHLISLNLGQLIHEDINRLELYVYLEGYKKGYYNNYWINILEKTAVKNISFEQLYNINYLYHFDTNIKKVGEIKALINDDIKKKEKENNV